MQVQPYIFFEGRCEEALSFYTSALNAEVTLLMRYSDMPAPPPGTPAPPPGMQPPSHSIMHASFRVGDTELMASDGMSSGQPAFKGITLSLNPASDDETRKIFAALAEGGHIKMPLSPTFFSPLFGMVQDKFGVSWMLNRAQAMA